MSAEQPFEAMGQDGTVFAGSYRVDQGMITVVDASSGATEEAAAGGEPDIIVARKMLLNLNGQPWAVSGFRPENTATDPQVPPRRRHARTLVNAAPIPSLLALPRVYLIEGSP